MIEKNDAQLLSIYYDLERAMLRARKQELLSIEESILFSDHGSLSTYFFGISD